MSRINHFVGQSKTILFWDYYILCRLDTEAAMILQRLEYWDGVKNGSNIVSEEINDVLVENGRDATQDTEQFVYKSQDELRWELMGLVATNHLGAKLTLLTTEIPYVIARNNPINPMDRKKQYHMAKDYVQIRLDYLAHIIAIFQKAGYRMNAVCYAIEEITKDNIYIEDLDILQIAKKLVVLCRLAEIDDIKAIENREEQKTLPKGAKKPKPYEPVLPKFLRIQLKKDKSLIESVDLSSDSPNFNFKEWETLKLKNGFPKFKVCIPQNQRISNNYVSSNYNQQIQTNIEGEASTSATQTNTSSPSQNTNKESVSPETIVLMDTWDGICGYLVPRDKKHMDAAKELARCGVTKNDLLEMQKFCLRTNPQWYEKNGVDLAAIARNYGKWKSLGSLPSQNSPVPPPPSGVSLSFEEAEQLAARALAESREKGYEITATAIENGDGWAVAVVWLSEKTSRLTIKSREHWDREFQELAEIADMLRQRSLQGVK